MLTEILSIKEMPKECRVLLLQELGFGSDGTFILGPNGVKVLDRYTEEPVRIDNMAIFPGSTIILDDNPLSISSYLEEFGDVV